MRLKFLTAGILLLLLLSCSKRQPQAPGELTFTDDVRLSTTPVKDQGNTSFCWIYAMLATIETEHIGQGDSVNLSVDYVARAFLREQATEGYMHGGVKPSARGMSTMALRLVDTYGLTHFDAYHRPDDTDLAVLFEQLSLSAGQASSLSDYSERADKLLDKAFGQVMPSVFFLGARYTPLEFAHSVCRDDEYEALTSFTHHPFGARFVLEVADNRYHDAFLNVPADTLLSRVRASLRAGHPVCWEGDVSEAGFSFQDGVATLPEGTDVSQESRQQQYESGRTTDDHCMEIMGMAHDKQGRRYFLMKNSWGTDNRFGGFMYVSEDYFKLKTIAVIIKNPC